MDTPNNSRSLKWMAWFWRILRMILGAVFIYASVEKIIYPEQFAHAIFNYKLLPGELVNVFALLLPWAEVVIGIFLIFGFFEWVSLTLFNFLMLIFITAIGISLARGLNISCGCFTSDPNAEKMTWLTLMRDASIIIPGLAGYLLLLYLKRPPFFKKEVEK